MSRLIGRSFPEAEVTGVDLREPYLEFARRCARSEQLPNVQFQIADVFALPFADASFDIVWTKYLLQWLKEPNVHLRAKTVCARAASLFRATLLALQLSTFR